MQKHALHETAQMVKRPETLAVVLCTAAAPTIDLHSLLSSAQKEHNSICSFLGAQYKCRPFKYPFTLATSLLCVLQRVNY